MAFGKKFYSSYKSNNNLDYYLEIWIDGHTGGNTELTMGAGGPVIEYETDQEDRFSPIISSSCKIPYLVEDNIDSAFVDTLRTTYQERQVYIHIYRASSSTYHTVAPLWSGFLVMDLGKGQDKSFPYVQELKFVDGLALLKDIDFVDLNVAGGTPPFEERVQGNYAEENMYFGPATYIYWFREILAKTGASLTAQGSTINYGFTTSVNWYNGDMNSTGQSSDPLHKTKCQVSMFHRKDDQEVYYPENCYKVLKELLRHWGARITYWKHEFWIVQIPEYITGESGTIDNPQNNFSRLYSNLGTYQSSQDHLGSTYWTRYFQEISNEKISKLTGTKYDYLPIVKQVNADFLSFSSKSFYGGFPFGPTALDQEVFQGTINSPSSADFLWLSIPLDWAWNCPNFPSGHTNGWWCSVKFNFYASDGNTTYYLQYNSTSGKHYWKDSSTWQPLGNRSPRYVIRSKNLSETAYVGFEENIPFEDENGSSISMSGAWSFYLDLHATGTATGYGTGSSNPGCFYLNFSGYGSPQRMRNPNVGIVLPTPSGNLNSGTVSWSNSLEDNIGVVTINPTTINPSGFNAGSATDDISFDTTSPFLGLLQLMTNGQSATYGQTINTLNTSSVAAKQNSEQYNLGTMLWGDATEFARSSLQVFDGTNYVNTDASGLWGRGNLLGNKTFTQLLIDEFLYGQTKIIISPSMRLAVGVENKNQTQGAATRPRYVNPIGKLRETRDGTDPEYFFRRGSFYTLLDEWDYEGYQIIRNEVTTTNQNNSLGNLGGNQSNAPNSSSMLTNPTTQALVQNSPLAYISQVVAATGSDVAVNGNFNVATGWTLGTGWTIDTTTKQAKFAATGSTSELVQSVLTQELTYQINFQVDVTAGTLLVKAGTSGQSQTITSSGDYSIYLTCEGSSDIKFQAGTTFTGQITYITLRDQKSLSSVPIEEIGSAVFKTGDTFNLINSNSDEILALTVTSNQGSSDTSISVSSTPLYDDIDAGSYLLINQDDLSAQYQNKTKGTVGGFDITATSIDSGSVAISSYIDDDSFATASATSLATSESIKAYVDTQVGSADTLQEVTDNGNTTTNSIMIGSSASPLAKLHTLTGSSGVSSVDGGTSAIIESNTTNYLRFLNPDAATGGLVWTSPSDNFGAFLRWGHSSGLLEIATANSNDSITFSTGNASEKMRLTSNGKLGVGVTNPSRYLSVNSANENFVAQFTSNDDKASILLEDDDTLNYIHSQDGYLSIGGGNALSTANLNINSTNGNIGIGTTSPSEKLHVVGDALITGDSHADAFKPAVSGNPIKFKNFDSSTEFARITDDGRFGIGLSNPSFTLDVDSGTANSAFRVLSTDRYTGIRFEDSLSNDTLFYDGQNDVMFLGSTSFRAVNLTATGTGSFAGQVTIPATPVASTDAASKGYVDAQIGANNDLQEVTDNGNTTTNSITFAGGTSTADITGQSITLGDGSADKQLKVFYSDGSYISYKGYAIEFNRANSYLIPTVTNSKNIYIGNNTLGYWNQIESNAVTHIWTNAASEKMRLTSGGNLLIGTTTDSGAKLSVEGGMAVKSGSLISFINTNLTYNSIKRNTSIGGLQIDTGASASMNILDNGNVLIGGTLDNAKLTVRADSGYAFRTENASGYTFRVDATNGNTQIGGSLTGTTATFSASVIANGNSNSFGNTTTASLNSTTGTFSASVIASGNSNSFGNTTVGLLTGTSATFSGQVTIPATPVASTDAASKAYVDAHGGGLGPFLPLTGGTLTGDLILGTTSSPVDLFLFGDTTGVSLTWSNADDELQFSDNAKSVYGDSGDLQIYHDGDNYIKASGLGDIIIQQRNNDKDIVLQSDDGVGGVADYIRLDGSQTTVNIYQNTLIGTTTDSGEKLQVAGNATFSGNVTVDNIVDSFGEILTFQANDLIARHKHIHAEFGLWARSTGTNGNNSRLMGIDGSSTILGLYTNGSEKARITSDGKLGLGTSSPTTKMEIAGIGNQKFLVNRTDGDSFFIDAQNGQIRLRGTDNIIMGVGADVLTVTNSNVGIGTTSPQRKLHLHESSGSVYLQMTQGSTGTTSNDGFQIAMGATQVNLINRENGPMLFDTNNSTKMSLLANGNLLIGTTTDSGSKLTVAGNTNISGVLYIDYISTRSGTNIDFRHQDGTTKMQLKTATGNLLIGTTTDDGSSKLQVNGDAMFFGVTSGKYMNWDNSANSLRFADNTSLKFGYGNDMVMYHDGNNNHIAADNGDLTITVNQDDHDIIFKCDNGTGGTTPYLTLDGSQETINLQKTVLIGTTTNTGTYKIDVAGKQRVQDTLELDDVLMLNAISTPSDPADGKSVIYMDSADGGIKCKINVGGTVVTRTIASFE